MTFFEKISGVSGGLMFRVRRVVQTDGQYLPRHEHRRVQLDRVDGQEPARLPTVPGLLRVVFMTRNDLLESFGAPAQEIERVFESFVRSRRAAGVDIGANVEHFIADDYAGMVFAANLH